MNSTVRRWVNIFGGSMVAALVVGVVLAIGYGTDQDKAPAFLPGIYTSVAQNDFCRIDDTLVIRRKHAGEDHYTVTRYTGFIRIREGKKDAPEFQRQTWDGDYQAKKRGVISVNEKDTIIYNPIDNKIEKGRFSYEKIE